MANVVVLQGICFQTLWNSTKYSHPILDDLCESWFSTLLSIKTKSRNRLNAHADMRIVISNKVQSFEKVLCNKHVQKSH